MRSDDWIWLVLFLMTFGALVRVRTQRDFYRAYFNQKQINRGEVPWEVVKAEVGKWTARILFS